MVNKNICHQKLTKKTLLDTEMFESYYNDLDHTEKSNKGEIGVRTSNGILQEPGAYYPVDQFPHTTN